MPGTRLGRFASAAGFPGLRLLAEWAVIFAGTLCLGLWALASGLTAPLDMKLLDFAASTIASPASDDIVLAEIDDRSLSEIGRWPWGRSTIAAMIAALDEADARSIVVDILFTEPSSPDEDRALARAIQRSGRVILPHAVAPAPDAASGLVPLEPLPLFRNGAAGTGHVILEPDADGTVRRVPVALTGRTALWPHLSAATYRALHGQFPAAMDAGTATEPYVALRPTGAYRTVPAAALVRGEVPADLLRGRTVIIAASAPGLGDIYAVSPLAGGRMSGGEIQANVLQDLSDNALIYPVGETTGNVVTTCVIVALFLGFWRLRPALCLVLATMLSVLIVAGSLIAALFAHQWLPPGPALLAIVVAYPLWGWRRLSAVSAFLATQAGKLEAAMPHPAHRMAGFDAVARQIGELEFLVDEVSHRRDFLSRVIETMPDALCVFGSDGGLMLANAPARALFGHDGERLQLHDLLLASRATYSADGSLLSFPDGRLFEVERSAAPDHSPWSGLALHVFSDVTARHRAESERKQMLEFLSHDMRAPQAAILGLVSQSQRSAGTIGNEARTDTAFAAIGTHARRTLQLADDFVQLARVAEMPLDRADHDMTALVEEALDSVWQAARDRTVEIRRTLPDRPVFVHCDGSIILRVLQNLLTNAVRYGRDGGWVEVSVCADAGQCTVVVADNGPGLPPERRRAPWQRFGSRGTTSLPGAGLGLAFAHAAVERHGGTITCESPPDGGTRIAFTLACESETPD